MLCFTLWWRCSRRGLGLPGELESLLGSMDSPLAALLDMPTRPLDDQACMHAVGALTNSCAHSVEDIACGSPCLK